MFGLGTPELLIILVIAFFIFGGKKLPEIGASLGRAIGSFKKGLDDVKDSARETASELPGVKEVTEIRDQVDKARDSIKTLSK